MYEMLPWSQIALHVPIKLIYAKKKRQRTYLKHILVEHTVQQTNQNILIKNVLDIILRIFFS